MSERADNERAYTLACLIRGTKSREEAMAIRRALIERIEREGARLFAALEAPEAVAAVAPLEELSERRLSYRIRKEVSAWLGRLEIIISPSQLASLTAALRRWPDVLRIVFTKRRPRRQTPPFARALRQRSFVQRNHIVRPLPPTPHEFPLASPPPGEPSAEDIDKKLEEIIG